MIQPVLSVELGQLRALNAGIEKLILATGKAAWIVLIEQSRLLLRDLIRATPPFGKHAFSETFAEQRRIGIKAVERDIRKVFLPLRVFVERITAKSPDLALALSLAGGLQAVNIKSRKQGFRKSAVDPEALMAIFRNIGMDGRIIMEVDPVLHQQARGRKGRVGRTTQYVVVREASIDKYIRETQEKVGEAKSGWMKAVLALKVKGIPAWIRKHLTPGVYEEKKGPEQSITVGNLIQYSGDFEARQFEAAIQNRERGMAKQLQHVLEYEARKANAA